MSIPFLFYVYFTVTHVCKTRKEFHTGFAIHNNAIWFYPAPWVMESNSRDPWYRKTYAWSFPWEMKHHKTEILDLSGNVVRVEDKNRSFLDQYDEVEAVKNSVSEKVPYTYTLKSGEIQKRTATIHIERRTWRAKWWPLIPIEKSKKDLEINFDGEVGEGTGSWKGGVVGTSETMLPNESPLTCFMRFERDRKFNR